MLDMKFVRENPDIVKENIKKKFQDYKLPLVNEVLMEDKELRQTQQHADDLRANRKKISKEIGKLMGQGKKEEAEEIKQQIAEIAHELTALEEKEIKYVVLWALELFFFLFFTKKFGLFFFIFHNNLKIIIGWRLLLYLHFYLSDYSLACFSICQTAKAKKAIPIRMHIILAAL